MLKLATIIDNPGEPPVQSQYRDPQVLRQLGYNGIVVYETTGLSGIDSPSVVKDSELRQWVALRLDHARRIIEQASAAGLDVYIFYDVLVIAADIVAADVRRLCCRSRVDRLCPGSQHTIDRTAQALESLLDALPPVTGVVLRFGDTDAPRLPYLVGNDVYTPMCARCGPIGRADRVIQNIERFYDLIVKQRGKRLIARAWNVRPNGMHDSVELARRITERLPGDATDDHLMLSFKFTQTDFWRYQLWNQPSLNVNGRPVIYELECQREYEGKGGIPDWQAPIWQNGHPEVEPPQDNGPMTRGLIASRKKINLAGLLAWVRGGGWGGPFVSNEQWIDANVFAVPQLADNPELNLDDLAGQWVRQRLGIQDEHDAAVISNVLRRSADAVLKGFYIAPLARQKTNYWHPNADWIQDDLVDIDAAWRIVRQLPAGDLDEVVREKEEAVRLITEDLSALKACVNAANRSTLDPLINTLIYTRSFFAALRDVLSGLVAYRRFKETRDLSFAELARQKMTSAENHWNHHTQRCGSMPGAATSFREVHFWELTQTVLSEVTEPSTTPFH